MRIKERNKGKYHAWLHDQIKNYIYHHPHAYVYDDDKAVYAIDEPEFYNEKLKLVCILDVYIRGEKRDYFYEVKGSNHYRARKRGITQLRKAKKVWKHRRDTCYILVTPKEGGFVKLEEIYNYIK